VFTAKRKAAYEALHPETVHGGDRKSSRQVGDMNEARFTADTATKTGQSERAVQRDAERGEKVCNSAMALLRGTHLDTGKYLDARCSAMLTALALAQPDASPAAIFGDELDACGFKGRAYGRD